MKRPSFRSNISRWIKIYHSINIVSRNIDRSIEARWFLTSMIARWMKAFSSRLRLDLIEFQLRRRKFRGGPPRYLIFLRRFRMRVRRGLKGTPRVTTFLGHRLTNEKREKFVFFFFLHSSLIASSRKHDGSSTRDYQLLLLLSSQATRFLDLYKQNKSIYNHRIYISRLGLFGIIEVWKKKKKK